MECHMDVEMFLDGYAGWEVGSPHHPIILHEMFQHTAEQGQKEAECMIHQCCWHGLPKLDSWADISAIQWVGPQTNEEDFRTLYSKVYKLRRLPGSLLWGLGWMKELAMEITSFLKDHLEQKGGKSLQRIEGPGPADVQPPQSKTPRRERRDIAAERDLTEVREAHWRALATVATLEEEIEWLSQSTTQGWPDIHGHSWSQDCCRSKSWRQNWRCHKVWLEEGPAPSSNTALPGRVQDLRKRKRPNCSSWISAWKICLN